MRFFAAPTIITMGLASTTFALQSLDTPKQLSNVANQAATTSISQLQDNVNNSMAVGEEAAKQCQAEDSLEPSNLSASAVIIESTTVDTALPVQETGIADAGDGGINEDIESSNITAAVCAAELIAQFGQSSQARASNDTRAGNGAVASNGRGRNSNGRNRHGNGRVDSGLLDAIRGARQRGRQQGTAVGRGRRQGRLQAQGRGNDSNDRNRRSQGGQTAQNREAAGNNSHNRNGPGGNDQAKLVNTIEASLQQLGQEAINDLCAQPETSSEGEQEGVIDDEAGLDLGNQELQTEPEVDMLTSLKMKTKETVLMKTPSRRTVCLKTLPKPPPTLQKILKYLLSTISMKVPLQRAERSAQLDV